MWPDLGFDLADNCKQLFTPAAEVVANLKSGPNCPLPQTRYAVEAKERQGARNDIAQRFAQGEQGRAREKAAKATGANAPRTIEAVKVVSNVLPIGTIPQNRARQARRML